MSVTTTIVGRLTADPEIRFIPAGDAVVKFTVARNDRKYNKQTSQWEDGESLFLTVTAWRQLAEGAADSLKKGDLVIVTGALKQRSWEKDGKKNTVLELAAEEIGSSVRSRKSAAAPVQEAAW
jgi:single-strand DNA-binding protein